ncbi:Protoporphyrinogen oxidase [Olea europaea subsp. europaea]|uniref:Protoporphyrinogen oxidase n=1 Tax=Olea europaea subsp. europaea TaxID=158383 RepID=A0A8S0RWX6_OLEEU|nr:Protoporphyrinogen oxidase [Olea europaea subsp. europaea]
MSNVASKVAVIGSGISGTVCASILAKTGISVTIFESARGPGGRMSQRREIAEDGRELLFDHGAPYFSLNASSSEVQSLVNDWESRGLVAEWKAKFGSFDCGAKKFLKIEEKGVIKKYVGLPGMNSICRALCHESGVESRFGLGIGRLEWLDNDDSWSLMSLDGQELGKFKGVVASDKNVFSSRFTNVTGRPPPIDLNVVSDVAFKLKEIPVISCFALMLAFEQPLSSIPVKGFSFKNSEVLSWAYCDSSKPGRSTTTERWVLYSTAEYAERIIAQTGLQKPSSAVLTEVAEELFHEFQGTGLDISQPFFKKAHRWGSAFPASSITREEKCFWDTKKRLAICGDFCVSPNVEGAICSGIAAASQFTEMLSSL